MKLSAEQLNWMNHNYFQGMGACYSHSTHGSFLDAHDYNIFYSGDPLDREFNMVNVKVEPDDVGLAMDQWEQYFNHLEAQFRVVLSPFLSHPYLPLLETRGYQKSDSMPGMVLGGIAPKVQQGLDTDINIRRVMTPVDLSDFLDVLEYSYEYDSPSDEVKWALTQLPNCELFVAYVDREPAAISMSYVTGDVVGVYWVGTKKAFRKRGLGAAVTWRAVKEGVDSGCSFASLQASELGEEPVYARMGFETLIPYSMYNSPAG